MNKENTNKKHLIQVCMDVWTEGDEDSHKDSVYVILKSLIGEIYKGVRINDINIRIEGEHK